MPSSWKRIMAREAACWEHPNTSFACDSWSIGMGGAWNINEQVRLNAGYFISLYSNYDKQAAYGLETYSRTNNVIGVGLDWKF